MATLSQEAERSAEREAVQASGRRERLAKYIGRVSESTMSTIRARWTPPAEPSKGTCCGRARMLSMDFVSSRCYQAVITIATLVAAVLVALQLDFPEHGATWYALDLFCLSVFSVEVIAKLFALRRAFFHDVWNIIDACLVVLHVIDLFDVAFFNNSVVLRVLRGLRVARSARLWKVFPQLQHISSLVSRSIASVSWGFVLLFVILYMGGILSTVALRDTSDIYPGYSVVEEEWEPLQDFNPMMYFGSVRDSMYTLFNLVILTEFSEFARAIWMQQPIVFFGFAAFGCGVCFGMQSFIITACVERAASAEKALTEGTSDLVEARKLEAVQELCDILRNKDTDGREVLTLAQLIEALEDEEDVRKKLEVLELPVDLSGEELFLLLDARGLGEVPHSELSRNAVRLVASSSRPFEAFCLAQLSMNRIAVRLRLLEQGVQSQQWGGSSGVWKPSAARELAAMAGSPELESRKEFTPRSGGLTWTGPLGMPSSRQPAPNNSELQTLLQPMFKQLREEVAARAEEAVRSGLTRTAVGHATWSSATEPSPAKLLQDGPAWEIGAKEGLQPEELQAGVAAPRGSGPCLPVLLGLGCPQQAGQPSADGQRQASKEGPGGNVAAKERAGDEGMAGQQQPSRSSQAPETASPSQDRQERRGSGSPGAGSRHGRSRRRGSPAGPAGPGWFSSMALSPRGGRSATPSGSRRHSRI